MSPADVSLKPIIAFCLVGDDNVDREAFGLLCELAGLDSPRNSPRPAVTSSSSQPTDPPPQDPSPANGNSPRSGSSTPTPSPRAKRTAAQKKQSRRALVSTKSRPISESVREEAKQTLQHIEQLIKSRREQAQHNMKRAVDTIKALPLKAAKEYDRCNLTLAEISPNVDIFMNCLYFLVDGETAKAAIFVPQKKNKRVAYAAKRKRYGPEDLKRLAKAENPKSLFRHRVPIGSGFV